MSWTFTTDGCPGVVRRPDAQLRIGAHGAFIGADVLAAERRRAGLVDGGRASSHRHVHRQAPQRGNDPDRLRVTGQPSAGAFAVRYFDGSTDVTNRVVAGTFRSLELAPGAAASLRVVVTVAANARAGAVTSRLVTAASVAEPSTVDGVRFTVRRGLAARTTEATPALDAELDELLARPDAARWIQVCQLDQG